MVTCPALTRILFHSHSFFAGSAPPESKIPSLQALTAAANLKDFHLLCKENKPEI